MKQFGRAISITALCAIALPFVAAAQEDGGESGMDIIEERLEIPPMDCTDAGMRLTCISTYLEAVGDKVPAYMEQQVDEIRENVTTAEEATARFDNMIETAKALEQVSVEGAEFSIELDRIGALIQSGRDRASSDPDTTDLVPRFEAELARWAAVREDLLGVNIGAKDLREALEAGRSRSILLMELEGITAALDLAQESVKGLEVVLGALQEMYDETNKELEISGTD